MPPQDSEVTRSKLLQAAGEVFAERGYRDATVREICERAGTNIAAVNYHFRGKDELYAAVLASSFEDAVERYPVHEQPDKSPEVALAEFIAISLERMLDEGKPAWHAQLTFREIADPTPHFNTIADRFMKPHFAALRMRLRNLLGPAVPEPRERLMALSVVSQIVFYKLARHAISRIAPEQGTSPEDRRLIARHITEVTLAAAKDLCGKYTPSES